MIPDGVHRDAGLLLNLARDRALQALAGLDEAGEGREHARRPGGLAAEQAGAVFRSGAGVNEHDDGRIGARKVLDAARRADAQVAGVATLGRGAALAAEAVPAMPCSHRASVSEQVAAAAAHRGADLAQLDETAGAP